MPTAKKKTGKSQVKVKDLKAKKNPKGGTLGDGSVLVAGKFNVAGVKLNPAGANFQKFNPR